MSSYSANVFVVGAGLGGLAAAISIQEAGHRVTVFENAAQLSEVGAGVQITSQTVNVFKRWGLGEVLGKAAAVAQSCVYHRYSDGKVLGEEPDWSGWMTEEFGAPVWDLHRGDMQLAMYEKARSVGVTFRFGTSVARIDCAKPALVLKSGETLEADLVVGADGLHGMSRSSLLGRPDPAKPTGDLAYRIVLNADQVEEPDLIEYMSNKPASHFWLGPHAHVVSYSLKAGKQLNIVLLVPDDLPESVNRAKGETGEMMALFDGWDPLLRRFLAKVDSVDKWRLMHHPGLETWHHPNGRFIMIGDAVHPMLPYLAQGANSAVMDGVVLGECLRRATSIDDLPRCVEAFEAIIKPRSERIVALTHEQRHVNHLPDGEEQRARDALMAEQNTREKRTEAYPLNWTNPKTWKWICNFKPYEVVDEYFAKQQ